MRRALLAALLAGCLVVAVLPAWAADHGVTTTTPAGGSGATGTTQLPVVTSFAVHAAAGRFCTRRSAACRRPGVFLNVDLNAATSVTATGSLRRRPLGGRERPAGSVRLTLAPGRHRVRLGTRRRLGSGRYTLALTAGGLTRRVRFRVR